jgi:hypothetical protein
MSSRTAWLSAFAGLVLAGCVTGVVGETDTSEAPTEAWREAADQACLARRGNKSSASMLQIEKIDGAGACGITVPYQVSAFDAGSIAVTPTAVVGCPLADAVEGWLHDSVQPAAMAYFGSPVVGIRQLSNYACRRPMGYRPGQMSEHSYGNALDVAEFKLKNGRLVTVQQGWRGAKEDQAFLREIAVTACQRFKTFLGPGVAFHHNHFHVDLARRGASGIDRYCRPLPEVAVPVRVPGGETQVAGRLITRGELLSKMPADVEAELVDPFGVDKVKAETKTPE